LDGGSRVAGRGTDGVRAYLFHSRLGRQSPLSLAHDLPSRHAGTL
jgi:hypothetical protein